MRECTVADVKARLDRAERFHFVDVREDDEYAQDHAAGAIHLGKGVIERDIETVLPNKQEPIVLYCGVGTGRCWLRTAYASWATPMSSRWTGNQGLACGRVPHREGPASVIPWRFPDANCSITRGSVSCCYRPSCAPQDHSRPSAVRSGRPSRPPQTNPRKSVSAERRSIVAIVYGKDTRRMLPRAVDLLGGLDLLGMRGKRVLLKPNVLNDQPPPSTTNPLVVAAMADMAKANGAAEVVVADGSGIIRLPTSANLTSTGMRAVAEAAGARVLALEDEPWVKIEVLRLRPSGSSIFPAGLRVRCGDQYAGHQDPSVCRVFL